LREQAVFQIVELLMEVDARHGLFIFCMKKR
jgi:hypothetical protein